jgi:hypothetical protein
LLERSVLEGLKRRVRGDSLSDMEAIVKLLLDAGKVDIESKDQTRLTLLWRVKSGYEDIAKMQRIILYNLV